MEEILYSIEDFFYDHKRGVIASFIILVGIMLVWIVFILLYNPLKIRFEGEDIKISVTKPSVLQYKAIAYDKKRDDYKVTWEVDGGNLDIKEGAEVQWQLPNKPGTYQISAISGKKIITNKVTIIENVLFGSVGEYKYLDLDSDFDGLKDSFEKEITRTDYQKFDSDDDGISDGDEIILGTDPLLKDEKKEQKYKIHDKENKVELDIKGKGNITKTTIDVYRTDALENINNIVSPLYYINSEGDISNIKVTLPYDKEIIKEKNINEENLLVYRLDEWNNKFVKLDSKVNINNSTIETNIKENSKLFIVNKENMKEKISTELVFLIDNSGSMYSKDQIPDSSENDVNFKRISTSNKMIDKLKGDYKFGAGKFTFDYTNLVNLTSDKEEVKNKINSIKDKPEIFTGTYIAEAIGGGLKQFNKENKNQSRRYIILLTDGRDTESVKGYDKKKQKEVINEAIEKGVRIFTVGLGKEIDKKFLSDIANQTSGKFYYAANADVLDALFEVIAAEINYDFIDDNDDHIDDSILISDSGFISKRDGFYFDNIPLKEELNGSTYGMALFSKLYYEGKLPKSLKDMSVKIPNNGKTVKAKGYDITGVDFGKSLYEVRLEELEFLSNECKDFRGGGIENSVAKIKNDYKQKLIEKGFSIYNQVIADEKAKMKKYENYILDVDSKNFQENMKKDGQSIFSAIIRLDILKYRDTSIDFNANPKNAMDNLKDYLNKGEPCILKLNDNYSVLAIKIKEDNANTSDFKIEVYDPNTAGANKNIECKRYVVSDFKTEEGMSKEKDREYNYKFTYFGKPVNVKISIPNLSTNL